MVMCPHKMGAYYLCFTVKAIDIVTDFLNYGNEGIQVGFWNVLENVIH